VYCRNCSALFEDGYVCYQQTEKLTWLELRLGYQGSNCYYYGKREQYINIIMKSMLMAFEVLTAVFKVDSGNSRVFPKIGTFEQGCGIDIPNDSILSVSF